MTGLIDLPEELLAIIASSLSKRNLAQLVSSCRHLSQSSSLLAHLWQDISLESDFPYVHCDNFGDRACRPLKGGVLVSAGRLSQYAEFVRSLSLLGPFRTEYYQILFPQLHKLCLSHDIDYSSPDGKDDEMEAEQQVNNAELVRRNPNIKELSIHVEFARPPSDFWEAIYSTLQDPICLHLSDVNELQGADVIDSFWRACTLFEEIESKGSDMDVSELLPTLSFPRLKRLVFRSTDWNKKRFYTFLQFDWFKQCPNLTKLHWELFYASIPVEAWAQAMERKTWPDLEDLSLKELRAEDEEDLAVMFTHLPPLRRFTLQSYKFGHQAFLALQNQLFANIRVLDMSETYKFTSQMAVNALEQCVHLEVFRAALINVEDLRGPWLCKGLKNLRVFFVTEIEASNDIAFHRLSMMSQLEECCFSQTFLVDLTVSEAAYPLQWKLGLGLERLVQLKKLRTIAFENAAQKDMGVDELVWLKENLPALKEVRGTFSRVKEKREELERFATTLGLEL